MIQIALIRKIITVFLSNIFPCIKNNIKKGNIKNNLKI